MERIHAALAVRNGTAPEEPNGRRRGPDQAQVLLAGKRVQGVPFSERRFESESLRLDPLPISLTSAWPGSNAASLSMDPEAHHEFVPRCAVLKEEAGAETHYEYYEYTSRDYE